MYSNISLITKQKIKKVEDLCIKHGLQKINSSGEDFIAYGFNSELSTFIVGLYDVNYEPVIRYADPDNSYLNRFNEYVSSCYEMYLLKTKSFEKILHRIINKNIKHYKELMSTQKYNSLLEDFK